MSFLDTLAYPKPALIKLPLGYTKADDPGGIMKADINFRNQRAAIKHEEAIRNRPKIFASLMEKITQSSIDRLSGHINMDELLERKDPLELWLAIIETHEYDADNEAAVIIGSRVRNEYNSIKQRPNEYISSFRHRFEDMDMDMIRHRNN